jgi:DNA polymerase-3 subunit epsilon
VRQIVLDTETTGLEVSEGHRIIEIGCIELRHRRPTGRHWHRYLRPGREVEAGALAVHGITNEFLESQPAFAEVVEEFLAFVGDAELVIHNAEFDVGFLNAEFAAAGRATRIADHCRVCDTLALARRMHPGQRNSLDALCKRYGIDNSRRIKHGAIMDSLLLASVYVELLGERQITLSLGGAGSTAQQGGVVHGRAKQRPVPLQTRVTSAIEQAHRLFVETLGPKAIWRRFTDPPGSMP